MTTHTGGLQDRAFLMRIIYGGQTDTHDFHFAGYDQDLLVSVFLSLFVIWTPRESDEVIPPPDRNKNN